MADYEIKNGWILCKLAVKDRIKDDMGIESLEWERFAIKIASIECFREYTGDGDYAGCCTIDSLSEVFTITVPFDVLIKVCVTGYSQSDEESWKK